MKQKTLVLRLDALQQDASFALRALRRDARFAATAIGGLAVGLSAALFIAAVARGVLAGDVPFRDAERLARVWVADNSGNMRGDLSIPDVEEIEARSALIEHIAVAARTRAAMSTADGTERIRGESVSAGYFDIVQVRPQLGRLFAADQYKPGAQAVVVIGDDLWRRKFGGSRDVIGRTIVMRGAAGMETDRTATIIGVMPRGFVGTVDPDIAEFWLPLEQYTPRTMLQTRAARMAWTLARLAPGATLAAANTELRAISHELQRSQPESYAARTLRLEAVGEAARERYRPAIVLLLIGAALLLLIACANLASLLLARLAQRSSELMVRAAIGAGRGRIVSQLLTESVLIAVCGGVLGLGAAAAGIAAVNRGRLFRLPGYMSVELTASVVVLALALIATTALLFGAAPSLLAGRAVVLTSSARTMTGSRRQNRTFDGLVIVQVALAVVLLVGGGLLLRSYRNLTAADVGYRTERIARLAISLDGAQFSTRAAVLQFARDADTRLEAEEGVTRASVMASVLPPWFDQDVTLHAAGDTLPARGAQQHAVDEDFFAVLGIDVLHGRTLASTDEATGERVAVVSASLARLLARDPVAALDRRVEVDVHGQRQQVRIVGVAGDVSYHGPKQERPPYDLYIPLAQSPDAVLSIAVLTAGDPGAAIASLQRVLGSLAPTSPQHWVSTMEDELRGQFQDARVNAWLAALFGASALLVAMFGVYGVMSHAVSRRARELSVRKALGALDAQNLLLVLRHAARLLGAGVAGGLALAFVTVGYVQSLVFGIAPSDRNTFAAVAVVLFAAGLLSAFVPAMRAATADPAGVLRGQ